MTLQKWVPAFELAELPRGEVRLYKGHGCQVAVFHLQDGSLHAVDNRCPHEGYPLDKGWVSDCVVTCPWHNYKFDVRDGRCVMGDEAVRTFPLRLDGDVVHLDVAPPDPAVEIPRLWASLEQGMRDRKLGQMARDVVRLLLAGVAPERVALEAARLDAAYAEYGTTHATPVAVDSLRYLARHPAHEAVLPLMQAFDLAAMSHVRRPLRPTPEPAAVAGEPPSIGARLQQLVEQERAAEAEAVLRGALRAEVGREHIEGWLYQLCADHFLDFGHALIYQTKLFELLDRVGWAHAPELLPAHLFRIVNGTREELLPEQLWFRRVWERAAPRRDVLMAPDRACDEGFDALALSRQLTDRPREQALASVLDALQQGAPLNAVADAISHAAAERMLRFSLAVDADDRVQEGWLAVTHTLTFAASLRIALQRFRQPQALRLILFAARFVIGAQPLDMPEADRIVIEPSAEPASVESIVEAIAQQHSRRAVSLAARYLAEHAEVAPLRDALQDACLGDQLTRPIVVAHAIKTTVAAFDEHAAMAPGCRAHPVLAAVRLLASPIRERRIGRVSHEAIRFVVDGKVPKTLT